MKKTTLCNALLCLCFCLTSFSSGAQYAPDQSYDGPISFGITSNNFVAFNVRYILTGSTTYRTEIRTDGPLTQQIEDGALRFDFFAFGGLSSVRIEMGNATAFKLTAISFYGKADGNISFIPNGNVASAVTFNSNGSFITQLNYNFSSNPAFSNLTSFTITGSNLLLDIDDVNFDPPQIILPVNLTSFEVNKVDKKARVSWSTASESNSAHFIIERSSNGIDYFKIIEVAAAGNSQSLSRYSSIDENPLPGNNFYRLVLNDRDGKTTQHGIKMLNFGGSAPAAAISSYPNPVDDIVTVNNYRSSTTYKIVNQAGAILMSGPLAAGISQLDVSSLAKGLYILILEDKTQLKFIKR